MRTFSIVSASIIFCSLFVSASSAQVERYELGQRLRRAELAWQTADLAHRAKATAPMSQAVRSFFGLQLRTAAARLDDAYFAIRGDEAPSDEEKLAISHRISISPLLAEASESVFRVAFSKFYDAKMPKVVPWSVRLQLSQVDGTVLESITRDAPRDGEEEEFSWSLSNPLEGDLVVTMEGLAEQGGFHHSRIQVSRVKDLENRCTALEALINRVDFEGNPTVRASLRGWNEIFAKLRRDEVQECDYPAARLLRLAEKISSDPSKGNESLFAAARTNDLWLTLANEKQEAPIRVRAPLESDGLLPVLFLFHGAGGSENMFFETYGAGRAVKLGIERGWLVVAPRQGFFGLGMDCEAMLAALEEIFPIDRKRVAMVGHSMGAAQVIRQAGVKPELFRAAVALGGGNAISKPERVKSIAWFVAAGEQDFGRAGAAALAKSLQRAEVRLKNKTYPEVEHLMIVQAALDELFAFLDTEMK